MITTAAFPDHNIDPKKKDQAWRLQFAKAIWNNWNTSMPTGSIFRAKANEYAEIDDYALNKQSVSRYQKRLLPDDADNESWGNISWETRSDGMVLFNIAAAKLQKLMHNIIATPINQFAKDAEDKAYQELKAKLILKQSLQGSELEGHPLLTSLPNEPQSLEELEIQMQYAPKLVRAKDIEESVQLILSENEFMAVMDIMATDLLKYGVAVISDDLCENNRVKLRRVSPASFGCSYTTYYDFRDITWAFEVVSVKLSELAKHFDEDQMKSLETKARTQAGNPNVNISIANNGWDIFKVDVLKARFLSYNDRVIEANKDTNGNMRVSKAKPSKVNPFYKDGNGDVVKKNQREGVEYIGKKVEVVYQASWVIDTDLIYDDGLMPNTPRSVELSKMARTRLGYSILAANFSNMRAVGMMEHMKSTIDDLNEATFKLRNARNSMVPPGWDIDLAAIENVALGAGGEKMKPKEILSMFFEKGTLISRRSGISMDSNVNYKAIVPLNNNSLDYFTTLANDIAMSKQALRDITGLNELTDGSTPNPKTLTTIANLANESTNNALYPYINAKRRIYENLSKAIIQRLQAAVRKGGYSGYDKISQRWVQVPKSILEYDYDILIEDQPSEEQRQVIYSLMMEDIKAGYISHAEVISVLYTKNLKHAAFLLSYKVEKGKERQQQFALQNTQANAQAQMQSNQMAEQLKMQAETQRHMMKMDEIDKEKSWEYKIAELKVAQADAAIDKKAVYEIMGNDA